MSSASETTSSLGERGTAATGAIASTVGGESSFTIPQLEEGGVAPPPVPPVPLPRDITLLTSDSKRIKQPDDIKTPLKFHQMALIRYCKRLEKTECSPLKKRIGNAEFKISTKIGVIGDVVGSGKTLSILGLISSTKNTRYEYNFTNQYTNTYAGQGGDLCQINCVKCPEEEVYTTSIIIVPHTIFKQWDTTIKTQTTLTHLCINNKKTLEKFGEIFKKSTNIKDTFNSFDIILISSTFLSKFETMLTEDININASTDTWDPAPDYLFRRVIFDEADTIKIPRHIIAIQPMFLWVISSTYKTLTKPYGTSYWRNYQTGEISEHYSSSNGFTQRTQLNGMINKGYIFKHMCNFTNMSENIRKYFVVKNSDSFVNEAFQLLPPKEHIIKCKTPFALHVLSQSASQEILYHINAGDIQGALDKLECDKVSEKDLIGAVTKDLTIKIENKKLEYEYNSKLKSSNKQQQQVTLEKIQNKIVELQTKIDNITHKLEESTYCNICFDDMSCQTIAPCCNTKFCLECITKWLSQKQSCPFCRASIDINGLIVVDEGGSNKELKKTEDLLSKLENLKLIIQDRLETGEQLKLLIFSDFSNTFEKMTGMLAELGIKFAEVKGSSATINKKISLYKNTDGTEEQIDCLLLNAEYCASGINLENTTDIIIGHKMSEEKIHQIIGRGQRPGRVGVLNVWKLRYSNEML